MQESASKRSSPSPIRSPTARAREAAASRPRRHPAEPTYTQSSLAATERNLADLQAELAAAQAELGLPHRQSATTSSPRKPSFKCPSAEMNKGTLQQREPSGVVGPHFVIRLSRFFRSRLRARLRSTVLPLWATPQSCTRYSPHYGATLRSQCSLLCFVNALK